MHSITVFDSLPDPRTGMNIVYPLPDIITIAFCAVLSGADNWNEVEDFGRLNKDWFSQHFNIPKIPSHDTFRRLFMAIDQKCFEKVFRAWACLVVPGKTKLIALDGKTSRRSHDYARGIPPAHILNAFDGTQSLVLGQQKIASKSNEITAIKEMLRCLDIEDTIVTIDAIGTQKDIVKIITEKKAQYVLSVKENQKKLHDGIVDVFSRDDLQFMDGFDYYADDEKTAHGRCEKRVVYRYVIDEQMRKKLHLSAWSKSASLIAVKRTTLKNGVLSEKEQYYISSVEASAQDFAFMIRNHWRIENSLHWVLDIAFREDDCRKRAGNSASNFSLLRKVAYNFIAQDTTVKRSFKGRRKMAGWSLDYLLSLLK